VAEDVEESIVSSFKNRLIYLDLLIKNCLYFFISNNSKSIKSLVVQL